MTLYFAREASKLWRKVTMEVSVELQLLAEKWKLLLAGLIFQYIHGLAAHGVHYLHRPGPILQDIGFTVLPELGKERGYISESVFTFIFISFILWSFHPFVFHSKRFYTVLLWCRVLAFLVVSQVLRIITFYATQLPGPNYHCREGSKLARLPPPESILEVLMINFPRGVIYGCGDLVFSSHMIFTLVFVRTYQKTIKQLAWLMAVILSLLIISSRKHYTVDVTVAWYKGKYNLIFSLKFYLSLSCKLQGIASILRYTVNLVVFFVDKKLPEMSDRSAGTGNHLLPVSVKEKDIKPKEKMEKLLNGNHIDGADRFQF